MKIAILTWVSGTSNYGSVLQAYALQEYLKSLGFDVTVLNYKPLMEDAIFPPKYKLYWTKTKDKVHRVVHKNIKMQSILKRTQLVCDEFVSHNIALSAPLQGIKGLERVANEYDVFICGSDQIWSMNKKVNPAYYLEWVPNTKLKISYAPSLPVHNLDSFKIDFLKEKLAEFEGISVREEKTAEVLKSIVDKDVISVLDPTLLVDKKMWENLVSDSQDDNKEAYIICYFLGQRDFYFDGINAIKKATGLPVKLIPTSGDSINFGLEMVENVGPLDFMRLIKNAKYVLTDSYHATIFSVIFHKEFYLFKRFDDNKNDTQNIRIYDLTKKLQIDNRIIDSNTSNMLNAVKLDYDMIDKSIAQLQEESRRYLAEHLPSVIANQNNKSAVEENDRNFDTVFTDKSKCSGCGACYDACPVQAIEMQEDEIGYKYPVINKDVCLKCGKCRRTCPLSNPVEKSFITESYIAATKDVKKSEQSSSGGVFPLLCEKILESDGVVYGAEIRKHNDGLLYVSHVGIEGADEICKLYNSKYIQSNTAGIYKDVKEKLLDGKKVLFSGTPCQVQGLINFLGKDYADLYTVEVICHGVPSHKIFHKYQNYISEKLQGTINNIVFRDKARGWDKNICLEYRDNTGAEKSKIIPFYESSYFMMFLKGDILRDSCLKCPFASRTRAADITLGDYWGAEYEHPDFVKKNGNKSLRRQGLSCVIVNSEKGKKMLNAIKEGLIIDESSYEKVALHNKQLLFHLPTSPNREKYLSLLKGNDYSEIDKDVLSRYSKGSQKSYKRNNLTIALRLFLSNFH